MTDSPININLDKLKGEFFRGEFAVNFSNALLIQMGKFKVAFSNALYQSKTTELKEIVHDIVASLRFLEIEDLVVLIYKYKEWDQLDTNQQEAYVHRVEAYCDGVMNELSQFLKN